MPITIGINDFVRRQTAASEYTHFDGPLERVAELALEHFHRAKPGYRDGVCLVPVPAEGFFCGVVTLEEGDVLVGRYEARREGEEPRKELRVRREGPGRAPGATKSPCVAVDVVLYRRDVLEEGNEPCTGEDWDIVSINGRLTEDEMPIAPMTLIANHFELDGGTATGMSPEEFETALRKSVLFWKDTPIEKKMSELVPPLRAGLKEAFDRIQKEWWRLEEESKPAPEFDGELKCPNCSGDNLEWQEYVLETRQILGVVDDELAVDLASARQEFECSKDEGLACKDCYHEFRVPQGLDVDHVEREDFEAKVR